MNEIVVFRIILVACNMNSKNVEFCGEEGLGVTFSSRRVLMNVFEMF